LRPSAGIQPCHQLNYRVQDRYADAVVALLFKRFNGLLQGATGRDAFTRFNKVPEGLPATIVAPRRAKGITYLATEPVALMRVPLTTLHYRPVAMAGLRAVLNSL
jgi:hypothetical protein